MSQQEFMPLNEIILDYERMPEKCTAEPEIKEVVSRQVVQVSLRDIVDAKGRAAQNFQRILVKAEKGKILNGEIAGEYRVFRIGNGAITLVYEAPDDCKLESDTINVFNSCSINDQTLPLSSTTPDYPIATASVKLVCPDGELEHKSNGVIKSKDNSVKYTVSANSRIPFRINYDVTPPSFKTSGIIHSSVLLEMRLPEEKGDFKFDGDAVWVISGQIVSQKSPKKSLLKITMTSDPSVDIAMRGTVSGKEGHSSITLKEKITSKGVEGDEKIVNDGDVLWAQWEAMVGRNPLLRVNGSSFALPVTTPSIDKETNIIALEMRDGYKNRVVFAVPPNPTIEGSMVGELILHLNGKQISGKSR